MLQIIYMYSVELMKLKHPISTQHTIILECTLGISNTTHQVFRYLNGI